MAQLVEAERRGESVSVVIFLGCCAFAKIDRHANESNVRPTFSSSSAPFLPRLVPARCSPRGERMIGWRSDSCYAFLARPTRRGNVYLFIRYTAPGCRRVVTVVHNSAKRRMPAATPEFVELLDATSKDCNSLISELVISIDPRNCLEIDCSYLSCKIWKEIVEACV